MADTHLGPQNNIYTSTTPGERIFGEGGSDTITASSGGNTLLGGVGDDVLNGGDGNDVLYGDDVTDLTAHNVLNGGGGADRIFSFSPADEIDAGAGDDQVTLNAIEESTASSGPAIKGGIGTDTLSVNAFANSSDAISFGVDSLFTIAVNELEGVVCSSFERIVFSGGYGSINIAGGAFNDQIQVNTGQQAHFAAGNLSGGGGNDSFVVYGTSDEGLEHVDGDAGTDSLGWKETSSGDSFADLEADVSKGKLIGDGTTLIDFTDIEALNINTTETTGNVKFKGGTGNDVLTVWSAASSNVDTGNGKDTVTISHGTAKITLGDGNDSASVDFSNASTANIRGGDGNDQIRGGSGGGTLHGDGGNDIVAGNSNRTGIFGDAGNDTLHRTAQASDAASTNAVTDGGAGRDTLVLSLAFTSKAVTLNLSQASLTLADGMAVSGCEIVQFTGSATAVNKITASNDAGGAAVNKVTGGNVGDILKASSHGATLDGGFGDDRLTGANGKDILDGGFNGNDTLTGGGGDDAITGGAGTDLITGGAGKDTFFFAAFHTGTAAGSIDIIRDFSHSQGDRIDLSALDANTGTIEDDPFKFIGAKAFTEHAGELRFEKFDNAGTANDFTWVSGDTNGDGAADFIIQAKGLTGFVKGDFEL
jgi:Ca2+-binding RTX toxin-like protein